MNRRKDLVSAKVDKLISATKGGRNELRAGQLQGVSPAQTPFP